MVYPWRSAGKWREACSRASALPQRAFHRKVGASQREPAGRGVRARARSHGRADLPAEKQPAEAFAGERGIRIEISDRAFDLLGNVGFDPVYGARPLKRAIQQQLENPLAQQILSGAYASGETVQVDAEGGKLVFAKG